MTLIRKPVGSGVNNASNETSDSIDETKTSDFHGSESLQPDSKTADTNTADTQISSDSLMDQHKVATATQPGQRNDHSNVIRKDDDSGSDWDPIEDSGDEFDHFEAITASKETSEPHLVTNQTTSGEVRSQDQFPPSLRIGQPPALNVVKGDQVAAPVQTTDTLHIANPVVNASHSLGSRSYKQTNPFMRKNSSNNMADVENSGPQWRSDDSAPLAQQHFQNSLSHSLPPQVSHRSATGSIVGHSPAVGGTVLDHEDYTNPWDDFTKSDDSGSQGPRLHEVQGISNRMEIKEGKRPAADQNSPLVDISEQNTSHDPPIRLPPLIPSTESAESTEAHSRMTSQDYPKASDLTQTNPVEVQKPEQTPQKYQAPTDEKSSKTYHNIRNSQKNEHYPIKHTRWFDESSGTLRTSPILIQSANGPCPLLALVNALVLSTPETEKTALVETLDTREQVSLGLLLDAVFDELMSGRRGDSSHQLPDVGDLYAFLVTLHTGMNVNPRFVSSKKERSAGNSVQPNPLAARPAWGTFEETREMRLYGAFGIPLIHGWLPRPVDLTYTAFERVAQTYEDAQNVQFHEEELEAKLKNENLTDDEQSVFMNLTFVKEFFNLWPTQLSDYGLQCLKDTLTPGQICILFRNDHFSTVYKEPKSGNLMTLVTDAGYATHDEIVWESLVDISGNKSELFSGNFQSVSHHDMSSHEPDNGGVWQTVQGKLTRGSADSNAAQRGTASSVVTASASHQHDSVPMDGVKTRTAAEQEDHDLALALQLQEEEEERQRSEQAARQREEALSQEYLTQEDEGRRNRPPVPPRRADRTGTGRVSTEGRGETPPPSYHQINNNSTSNAVPHQGSGNSTGYRVSSGNYQGVSGQGRRQDAITSLQNNQQQLPPRGRQPWRKQGQPGPPVGGANTEKDEKCVMM